MTGRKKIVKALAYFIICTTLLFTGCSNGKSVINSGEIQSSGSKEVNGQGIRVHFIDVGQADSILIQEGEHSMLIDAGNNDDGKLVCDYIKAQGVDTLEYVVGTHPHEDHIGGLDDVIKAFNVKNVYMPRKSATTKTYRDVLQAIKNKKLTIKAPEVGYSFQLGEADFKVMAPHEIYEDANNCSIVLKMKYGNNSALFTGDAEKESEQAMMKGNPDLKCDVLKVAHHGSRTSSSQRFIEAVKPSFAVISVGKDNEYDHPKKATMERLQNNNIPVYRTDEAGTIVMTSDGNNIEFSSKPGSYRGMISTNSK